ncbi:hypothetical protein ScPMuIL_016512 [Solemya velum]
MSPLQSLLGHFMMTPKDSIPEFYNGQTVFITGATGFMGKVLMEKLLRSCPGIRRIYILIRPKRGKNIYERLEGLLQCPLYERVKNECPNFKNKVMPILGDILQEDMGISQSDIQLLVDETTVVFHSAATVKFNEELKLSIDLNVLGCQKILNLCKKMRKLQALVHISTAYANCHLDEIDEKIYDPPLDPHQLISATKWMDSEMFSLLTAKLVGCRPNTYTYTKAIAESLFMEDCGVLPIAIVRPSIVGATWKEPVAGWVDNFNGPSGLYSAIGHGLLRVMKGDRHAIADLIPCDIAVKAIIAVAWHTAVEKTSELKIYNCTSGHENKCTWGFLEKISAETMRKFPLNRLIRVPQLKFTKSSVWYYVNLVLDHTMPAYFRDSLMWITGRKPMFVKINNRIHNSAASLEYFTSNSWHFCNDNLYHLLDKLSSDDRENFNFDPSSFEWPKFAEVYALGTKQYLHKEELSDLPQARAALKRLQRVNFMANILIIIVVWRLLINRVAVARSVWQFLIGWVLKILQKIPGIAKSS